MAKQVENEKKYIVAVDENGFFYRFSDASKVWEGLTVVDFDAQGNVKKSTPKKVDKPTK